MARWVIFFRGINVGGHRKVPMAELREKLTKAGFGTVASYIQSGNVVADMQADRDEVATQVAGLVETEFGFPVDVLVLTRDELRQALSDNPFAGTFDDPSRMYLFFHMAQSSPVSIADLTAPDSAQAAEGALAHYLMAPDGMSKSALADKVSRRLAGHATARNERTCRKVLDMADG